MKDYGARSGFLSAVAYIELAARLSIEPRERDVLREMAKALRRKVDADYPVRGRADA